MGFTGAVSISVPTSVEPQQKRSWKRIEKKDEKIILKGLREFRPLYMIARDIGVSRNTLYKYLREELNVDYKDAREAMLDVAESRLLKNVLDGNQNAIEFLLDRQGKSRGYGEKQQLDRQDVPTINIGRIEIKPQEKVEVVEVKQ